MSTLFVLGRLALVLIFILSGATKLWDIPATAAMIAGKVTVPEMLSGVVAQLQSATGRPLPQLLAIASGAIEVLCGLMIAFHIGTRFAAFVLVAFTAVTTFYFHDFWNMAGDARALNMIQAQKNLSIIGGLLVMFVLGAWRPPVADLTEERLSRIE